MSCRHQRKFIMIHLATALRVFPVAVIPRYRSVTAASDNLRWLTAWLGQDLMGACRHKPRGHAEETTWGPCERGLMPQILIFLCEVESPDSILLWVCGELDADCLADVPKLLWPSLCYGDCILITLPIFFPHSFHLPPHYPLAAANCV